LERLGTTGEFGNEDVSFNFNRFGGTPATISKQQAGWGSASGRIFPVDRNMEILTWLLAVLLVVG